MGRASNRRTVFGGGSVDSAAVQDLIDADASLVRSNVDDLTYYVGATDPELGGAYVFQPTNAFPQSNDRIQTFARGDIGISETIASGTVYWTYFMAEATKTCDRFVSPNATAAVYGGAGTGGRVALATCDQSTLALSAVVCQTAFDSLKWLTANSMASGEAEYAMDTTGGKPSSYKTIAGTIYAFGQICVTTGTLPTWPGQSPSSSATLVGEAFTARSPKIAAQIASQADIALTVLANSKQRLYGALKLAADSGT